MSQTANQSLSAKPKRLAIIDGKSVFYRGYYAMPNLATKDGLPTSGVYGFAVMALEVLKRLKPDYVCVAWDKPKTNIRKRLAMYPAYKAGRKPAPADFYEQIPLLHELLKAFGWPLYELDDYEADDIMGTLAAQASKKGIETLLITSDMDMLQLIDANTHVYALKKGLSNIELYSPASFTAKYGIQPSQFLDLKALKGDASDNIPGVPGIGEKGALDLLKSYKTLDGVYENLALLRDTLRRKLETGKELAYLSKQLAAIWTDAPIKLNLTEVDGHDCDPTEVHQILRKLEFRNLVHQLPDNMQPPASSEQPSSAMGTLAGKVTNITTPEQLASIKLEKAAPLFVHGRSAGKHGRRPLVLIISANAKTTYALDLTKLQGQDVGKLLAGHSLIGYDLKSTLKILLDVGLELPPIEHDVQIGNFLINSLDRTQTLTELAQKSLDYSGASFDNLSEEELVNRAAELTSVIAALYHLQNKQLSSLKQVQQLAKKVEWPVIPVLAHMEYTGIKLDTKYLKVFAEKLNNAISDLEQQIYGLADKQFNISSPSQLADILFVQLELPTTGIKKGKTGFSTAASELDKLRGQHAIIDMISQYREVTKLKSTYVDALPQQVDQQSRLHTTFNMTVAQTGRLSSADPNLQNIPVRTELGKHIRTAFVAEPGHMLVSADYSQFELRVAAVLSGDKGMLEAFNNDTDIHVATAAAIYGVRPEDVTKQQRYSAKAVNFGIMYGQGPHGLSQGTGMPFNEARDFIARYFQIRPQLKEYIESLRDKAKKDGYVETLLGRRRPTPDVNSSNFAVREAAYRAAVNMPMQGTAADLMKLAMVAADQPLRQLGANQLLQIHDSILVECPANQAKKVSQILVTTMEGVYKLPVKLTVEVTTGHNWGDL